MNDRTDFVAWYGSSLTAEQDVQVVTARRRIHTNRVERMVWQNRHALSP